RLAAAGDTIAGAVCPPDAGGKPDAFKQAAEAHGVPVHQFRSLKTPEARRAFEDARADLAALVYVTQIVPEPLLQIPRLTTICFHPSLLPRYRGGSAIPWQLIRGETRTGVTVFWPDAGIDTGPILLHREVAVDPDVTAGSLYYRTLFPLGVETVLAAVALIRQGRAPRLSVREVEEARLIAAEVHVEQSAEADVHVHREADRLAARDGGRGDDRSAAPVRLHGAEDERVLGVGRDHRAGVVHGDARAR